MAVPQDAFIAAQDAVQRVQLHFGQLLHDELGQQLTAAALMARALASSLAREGSPYGNRAALLAEHLQAAMQTVRSLPHRIDDVDAPGGLRDLLSELAGECHERVGIPCRFRCAARLPELSRAQTTQLYRIAQQAITNAVRHSRATQLSIRLIARRGDIVLAVRDNGLGFDPDAPRSGSGLHGMRYRAGLLGGALQLRSVPGCGTLVRCRVQLCEESPRCHSSRSATTLSHKNVHRF